jgi:hypothetical protein
MRNLHVLISLSFCLMLLLTSHTLAHHHVTGTWILVVNIGGRVRGEVTFEFTQKGEKLTGTYWGALGRHELSGTVKGDDVAFSFQSQVGRVSYTGKITGATFAGKCDYSRLGDGTFKGQKAGTAAI